jgi:hypothetical protein
LVLDSIDEDIIDNTINEDNLITMYASLNFATKSSGTFNPKVKKEAYLLLSNYWEEFLKTDGYEI